MQRSDIYSLAVPVIVGWIILIYFVLTSRGSRNASRPPHFHHTRSYYRKGPGYHWRDSREKLSAVKKASFHKKRLLNREEYPVFKIIETEIAAARRGYRVLAQTSLGEILGSQDQNAFHSINARRVDILIVDQGGRPVGRMTGLRAAPIVPAPARA